MTENRRRIERKNIDVHVNIVDMQTEQHLGALINIHPEGLMLVGSLPLEIDRVYQIQLQPIGKAESLGPIELGVDCVWSSKGQGSNWAGCRIIDTSTDALRKIEQLIQEFAI